MKNSLLIFTTLALISTTNHAKTLPKVALAEANLIFKAAGFSKTKNNQWKSDCGIGEITEYKDLNGDGLKDAVIQDESYTCYGNTGVGYQIVSQQKSGQWKTLYKDSGIPKFLASKGKDGWLDIENGGSGFCFAVLRWDGKTYDVNRYEYQGKACSLF